ncbi:hypothetical protein HN777_02675 [Candidatus Woesearchaeota archaeon]|jgi:hypothetical protein|nr:hypothetical protein [Candidatus Woesearchaeota archaeon]
MSNGKKLIILGMLLLFSIFLINTVSAADCFDNSTDPIPICSCLDMNRTKEDVTTNYQLQNNIDCSDTINWNGGAGWAPIAPSHTADFVGTFDGQGYTISDLYINNATSYMGLFGWTDSGGNITNFNIIGANYTGSSYIGGITSYNAGASISYVSFQGNISGVGDLGGITGVNIGDISYSYTIIEIQGSDSMVGGLVGDSSTSSQINNSYAIGTITSSGWQGTAGIIGRNSGSCTVFNSYAHVNITQTNGIDIAGFVGTNNGVVTNGYSTGTITGGNTNYRYGFGGGGTCTASYWDTDLGLATSGCGTGKTTAQMTNVSTYTTTNAWDFQENPSNDVANNDYWGIATTLNAGYPALVNVGDGAALVDPVVSLNSPADNYYIAGAETITFNCSVSSANTLSNITLYITDSNNTNFAPNQTTTFSGTSGSGQWDVDLSAGNHTWNCLGEDTTNRTDWNTNRSIILDNEAPVFSTFANQTITTGSALSYTMSANDSDSGVDCYTINDTTNFAINCSGYLENNTALSIATYWINVTVNDSAGNENSQEMSVEVTAIPSLTISLVTPIADANVTQNDSFTFSVNVTCHDANCGSINVSLDPNLADDSEKYNENGQEYQIESALVLYDNKSFDYDVQDGCDLSDGESDVFDGGLKLYINNSEYTGTRSTTEDSGREAICDVQTKSSINVSRKVYVPAAQNWARYLEVLYNPEADTICIDVKMSQNMGSDGSDFMNTSDYDSTWEITDYWMMWDDTSATGSDDAAGFIYHHNDGTEKIDSLSPATASGGVNNWVWENVCVPAGGTTVLMHFFTQWDTRVQSETELDYIYQNIGNDLYTTGMSDDEISQVANLNLNSAKSGLISTVTGDTPFYTTDNNPSTITLNQDESQTITWTVNATGEPNTTHEFFAYVNKTSDTDVGNETIHINLTIVNFTVGTTPPSVSILYPEAVNYATDITELNYTVSTDQTLDECWWSSDQGDTNSSAVSANTNFDSLTSVSGTNIWTVYCNDNNSLIGSTSVTFSKVPGISLTMISPTGDTNVTQNDTFSVSASVTCNNIDCANINVSLDPTDRTPRTCSGVWGESCVGSDPTTANYSINCSAGSYYSSGFWVDEVTVDATTVAIGDTINITCNYDCYSSSNLNDLAISYYNGTWNQIWSQDLACTDGDYSAQVNVSGDVGEQWARCQIAYYLYTPTGTCFTTTYSDNDDVNFTVIDSTKSGLVSTTVNDTPFYTTTSNPYTVNLDEGESETITWTVNATGELNTTHEFFIYANWTTDTDVSNITSTWNVTITNDTVADTTNPTITFASPTNNTSSTDTGLDVLYSASDTNLDSCWYANDSMTTNTTLASCANITDVTWSEATHTVFVWANDSSGNEGSSDVTFTIDATSPVVTVTSPSNNSNSSSTSLNVMYNVIEDNREDCWYSNDSMLLNTTLTSCTDILTVTWSEGEHNVTIWANDSAGNVGNTDVTFTIDATSPVVTVTSPSNNTNTTDGGLDITYSASDTNLDSCWYANDSMTTNTTLTSCANITDVTWSEGEHNVTIWANDSSNNIGSSDIIFNIDTINPIWSNNKTNITTTTTSGQSVYFNVTLSDSNPEEYIFSWYNSTDWSNDSAVSYTNGQEIQITKTLPTSSGDINWTFYFNDTFGNANQTDVWSVTLIPADEDNDGIADNSDPLLYNESNVTSSGVTNLNISIGGNSTNESVNEVQDVVFYDDDDIMINFSHNFTATTLDLSNVSIIKDTNSIIVNISNQLQGNKTLYINDNEFVSLCVKDADVEAIDNISSSCDSVNETDFTTCLNSNTTINEINCTDLGATIQFNNLQYSAIKGTQASSSTSSTSSGGGNSGGTKISSVVAPECLINSDCNGTDSCYKNKCVKLFDVEIISLEPSVDLLSFDLKYLVKGMANISNDVVIKFWLQDSGKNIILGKDTIYLGNFETKTKTTSLNLPKDIENKDYLLYVEVSYDGYNAESFRRLNVDLEKGLTLDVEDTAIKEYKILKYSLLIIVVLLVIIVFAGIIFYFENTASDRRKTKQKKSKEYNKLALELNKVRRKYMKNYNKLIKLTDKGKQNSSEGEKICSKCIQLRTEYDNLRENLKNI